jgi:predicted Holliday junction resolvase-like endonuclease
VNSLPIVALGVLLAFVTLAWAWTHLQYARLQARIEKHALQTFNSWRGAELEQVRQEQAQLARASALVSLEEWKAIYTQEIRREAIRKSDSVTLGKVTEHLVPYLPDFTFNPRDARFLGSPVDFVVFDGLSEGELRSVYFVEIKTGKSSLNTRERRVRDAVLARQVEWLELRPGIPMAEAT